MTAPLVHAALASRQYPKHSLGFRWRPNKDTAVALASYALVVAALYLAFQVFTTARVAANFITYGVVGLAGFGVALPVLYTVVVRRRPLADIGITTRLLVPSLMLGLVLGTDTYRHTVASLGLTFSAEHAALLAMTLAVGLFEAVFFRGWLQLRFEAAFGVVPGLLAAAACYSLYHVGYGMNRAEMLFLFGYGLTFGAMFRLTRNVFVLWPFYTPVGSFYSNIRSGLELPFEATYGFVLVLALMAAAIATGALLRRRRPRPDAMAAVAATAAPAGGLQAVRRRLPRSRDDVHAPGTPAGQPPSEWCLAVTNRAGTKHQQLTAANLKFGRLVRASQVGSRTFLSATGCRGGSATLKHAHFSYEVAHAPDSLGEETVRPHS